MKIESDPNGDSSTVPLRGSARNDTVLRRSSIAAIFAAITNVLTPIAPVFEPITHILTTIAHIFAAIAHVLEPVATAAIMQRVTPVLATVANVLGAVATVLHAIPDVLAAVADVLAPVTDVFEAIASQGPVVELRMEWANVAGRVLCAHDGCGSSKQGRGDRSHSEIAHRIPQRQNPALAVVACAAHTTLVGGPALSTKAGYWDGVCSLSNTEFRRRRISTTDTSATPTMSTPAITSS
jgi:hypothetical protein